jgi:outer membrane receptor for ferrienterochelin and colicin
MSKTTKVLARPQSTDARFGAPTLAAACVLAMLQTFGPQVLAQQERTQLEEIVVTATRTGATNLQDIPMSISALAPDKLASQGLNSLGDTLRAVPGVVLNAEQQGYNRITMRGLVAADMDYTQVQDRSLVGMYLDEIPIGLGTHNPDLRVLDMERIEVIRGPQGTLYGAGSMGGTVRYITRKPDPSKFAATVETQGSYTKDGGANWNAKASANMPLVTDKLALRAGVYRESLEGYVDNVGTGKDDANTFDNTQANAALRCQRRLPKTRERRHQWLLPREGRQLQQPARCRLRGRSANLQPDAGLRPRLDEPAVVYLLHRPRFRPGCFARCTGHLFSGNQ